MSSVSVTIYNPDTTAPSVPTGLAATGGSQQVSLSCNASSDPAVNGAATSGLAGYRWYVATTPTGTYSLLATTTSPSYTHTGLGDTATRYYKVAAYDSAGNQSTQTAYVVATTATPNRAPTFTVAPTSATISSSGGTIQFTASDPDGDILTYTLPTPPSGYSINSATGLVTVAVGAASDSITVRATDPQGLSTVSPPCAVTVQAVTGTTYWRHDPAESVSGLVSSVPVATHVLRANSDVVTVDGRKSIRILINDNQTDQGVEQMGTDPTIGWPFSRSVFFKFWLKFDTNYRLGTAGERKWKIGRLGLLGGTGMVTFYYNPDSWEMGELYDGSAVDRLEVFVDNNPESDTSLRNWNEVVFEIVYPPSAADISNSYFRVYRNGQLLGTSPSARWFSTSVDQVTQWGGVGTRIFAQLNSGGTGGGYIYVGETSITDYWDSAYPKGS